MRQKQIRAVWRPLRLHLEFEKLSAGEVGSIMTAYQAPLRQAWRSEIRRLGISRPPSEPRVILTSLSTASSLDLLADYGLPALVVSTSLLGPVRNWPAIASGSLRYMAYELTAIARREPGRQMRIVGPAGTQLELPVDVLEDLDLARRAHRFWKTTLAAVDRAEISIE